MKELGITEDMIYNDPVTSKGDTCSYGKHGGKKVWMGRYQGGRKRFATRERESSSSFQYEKDVSRSPSPPRYKTHVMSHSDMVSSVGITSSPKIFAGTELESQECLPSNRCSIKSGDFQEQPSSQASDNSSQCVEREESAEILLSQASHGSRDSVCIYENKRQSSSGETSLSSRLLARKQYESESDDTSSKERDSCRKPKKYDSKGRYSKRQLVDKSSESDSKERDREQIEERERWKRYRSRRSKDSPKRKANSHSDDEKQPKQGQNYESDRLVLTTDIRNSPRGGSFSLHKLPVQSEADNKVHAEVQLIGDANQINPMDLDNLSEASTTSNKVVKQESWHDKIDLNYDQVESRVSAQLDTHQTEPQVQSTCTRSMSYTPPIGAFDFERDETPPAEIVEATAEWCRTQNFPPTFNSVSLQDVFQYYQNSMAADGTKNKKEDGYWHNSVWPGIFQQRDQQVDQSLVAASSNATAKTTPTCISQSVCPPNINLATEPNIFNAFPKSIINNSEQSKEALEVNFPTVQLEAPSYSVFEAWSSHLRDAKDGDSHQLSDSEVQQHLEMFLNKPKPGLVDHSLNSESILTQNAQLSAGVESNTNVTEATGLIGSEHRNDIARYCRQQGREPSPRRNSDLRSPYHDRDQSIYTTPENRGKSYLTCSYKHSGVARHRQERNRESSQHLSNQGYLLEEHTPGGNGDHKQVFPHDHSSTLCCTATVDSVEQIPAYTAEKAFHHRYDPRETELAVNRGQWREGEHMLSKSQEHAIKGFWRAEELGCVRVSLRREKTDNSEERYTYTCGPHGSNVLLTRGEAHGEATGTPLNSTCMFYNQPSLNSIYQPSSATASETCNEYVYEREFQSSQSRRLNEPTAREHYLCYNPSTENHGGPSQVGKHYEDVTASPLSGYPPADMDKFRMSPTDLHSRRPQLLSTDRDNQKSIQPRRSLPIVKMKNTCTPLLETSEPEINSVLSNASDIENCDLPQKMFNGQNERDQLQRMLDIELAEKDMKNENAKEVINKTAVQDKDKSTCVYTSIGDQMTQPTAEQSLDTRSVDTEVTTQISRVDVRFRKRRLISHKYKHLQKQHYKVNIYKLAFGG